MSTLFGDVNWRDYGLTPAERAERFANDMRRFRGTGGAMSHAILTTWLTHLINAVMADRMVKMAEEHRESVCPECGSPIYCFHSVELQKRIGSMKLDQVVLKSELAAAQQRVKVLEDRVRFLESHYRGKSGF